MKALLIYPPLTLHKSDVSMPAKSSLIGLGYLAAVLQKKGHQVKVLDCLASSRHKHLLDANFTRIGLKDKEILKKIKAFAPDVVGISSMFTSYFKDAHNLARMVKKYNKNILVIFGGVHTSTFPEMVMEDKNVDVAVIGEGEITLCEVLERLKQKRSLRGVKGIIHRVNGKIKKEKPREFIRNLDNLPFPAWELLKRDLKIVNQEGKKSKFQMRYPIGHILTSRGCPNNCYFCSVKLIWSRKWRARSAKNVVDEIEYLKDKYGYQEFHFVDDNASVSKKRMHQLCDELSKRNLDVKLATPAGIAIKTLDKEILRKMKKAGFYRLCFGIESGDSKTQKIIKKNIDLVKAKETIDFANHLGFWTSATFIIGFPHERMKEIKATLDFAKESNLDFAIFYLLTPQPETQVYKILKKQGLINLEPYLSPHSPSWYKISLTYSNGFKTKFFSNRKLQETLAWMYKEFLLYKLFSLQTYINILKKTRSFEDLVYTLKLITIPLNMLMAMIFNKKLSNISIYQKNKELERVAL